MSELIGIVGATGTGKSTAIMQDPELGITGLDPETTFIINIANKPLPFKGWKTIFTPLTKEGKGNILNSDNPSDILKTLDYIDKVRTDIKHIVIDDFQYILAFEFMAKALEKGYEKFSIMAKNAFDILNKGRKLREDLKVFVLTHSEEYQKDFETVRKMKTIGKLLDDKVTLEGLFTVLLYTHSEWDDKAEKGTYFFITNRTNDYPAKSPVRMFDSIKIPNDLGYVSNKINEYNQQ